MKPRASMGDPSPARALRAPSYWLLLSLLLSLWSAAVAEPVAASTDPPEAAVLATLPFEPTDSPNRIYVNLAPEGSPPFVLLLDTGASGSVLTPGAARKAGVIVRRAKNSPYRRKTLLGRDIQFWIDTSSSDTGSSQGWEYGVLGTNFLEEYVVELDFEQRRVRLLDADEYRVPKQAENPNEAVLPIRLNGRRPLVEIELNGNREFVLFDTGVPSPLILSGSAAKKFGIDVKSLPDFSKWQTTRGVTSTRFYEADQLRLAGFDLGVTPVAVAPHGWYNLGGPNDSALGLDIIQQFTVRIDYPRKRMWLRRERTKSTYLGVDYELTRRAGVFVYPFPAGLQVTWTRPGSPSAQIGLLPGDLIDATFNGQRDLRAVLERVARKERIYVVRELEDGTLADMAVPEHEEDELATATRLARDAAIELEKQRVENWKLQRDEKLYTRTTSGWVVVDGYRRRQGPKEGEEWLTFDEMQKAKSGEAAAD